MVEFVTEMTLAEISGNTTACLRTNIHLLLRMVLKNGYSIKKHSPFMLMWDGREKRKTQ
jgi:hypothetical protein